jgi:hypothetical protein
MSITPIKKFYTAKAHTISRSADAELLERVPAEGEGWCSRIWKEITMRSTAEVLDHHLECFVVGILMAYWQTTQRTRCKFAIAEANSVA